MQRRNFWFIIVGPTSVWLFAGSTRADDPKVAVDKQPRLVAQLGHSTIVCSVAFSPDGKQVLTGSEDKTARLWDAQSGKELRAFMGHRREVTSVAFAPDGKLVLTGSMNGTARLWDVETGKEIRTFTGHDDDGVTSVAFSPDGKQVLTGSAKKLYSGDGTAGLWDVRSGKEIRTFTGHADGVKSVAFSPDGKQVLTGSGDKAARLWDAQTGKELRTFAHAARVNSVSGLTIEVTSRKKAVARMPELGAELPTTSGGLECIVLIDGRYAATLRFRDQPRADSESFIHHLRPRHRFDRVLLVSGDRESEVCYLAGQVGIAEVRAGQTPEQKLEIVRAKTRKANTVFLGDGINDAPALTAATVGIACGQNSDVISEAGGAVILESSLERVDEFLHISGRLRTIALQSAVGGMVLSLIGMVVAAAGYLPPVAGAIFQEVIDVAAVVNALRMAVPPRSLTDY